MLLSAGCGVAAPIKGIFDRQNRGAPFLVKSKDGTYQPIRDDIVIIETVDSWFYRFSVWVYRKEGTIEGVATKYQTLDAANEEEGGSLFEGSLATKNIAAIYEPGSKGQSSTVLVMLIVVGLGFGIIWLAGASTGGWDTF